MFTQVKRQRSEAVKRKISKLHERQEEYHGNIIQGGILMGFSAKVEEKKYLYISIKESSEKHTNIIN